MPKGEGGREDNETKQHPNVGFGIITTTKTKAKKCRELPSFGESHSSSEQLTGSPLSTIPNLCPGLGQHATVRLCGVTSSWDILSISLSRVGEVLGGTGTVFFPFSVWLAVRYGNVRAIEN